MSHHLVVDYHVGEVEEVKNRESKSGLKSALAPPGAEKNAFLSFSTKFVMFFLYHGSLLLEMDPPLEDGSVPAEVVFGLAPPNDLAFIMTSLSETFWTGSGLGLVAEWPCGLSKVRPCGLSKVWPCGLSKGPCGPARVLVLALGLEGVTPSPLVSVAKAALGLIVVCSIGTSSLSVWSGGGGWWGSIVVDPLALLIL